MAPEHASPNATDPSSDRELSRAEQSCFSLLPFLLKRFELDVDFSLWQCQGLVYDRFHFARGSKQSIDLPSS